VTTTPSLYDLELLAFNPVAVFLSQLALAYHNVLGNQLHSELFNGRALLLVFLVNKVRLGNCIGTLKYQLSQALLLNELRVCNIHCV